VTLKRLLAIALCIGVSTLPSVARTDEPAVTSDESAAESKVQSSVCRNINVQKKAKTRIATTVRVAVYGVSNTIGTITVVVRAWAYPTYASPSSPSAVDAYSSG